MTIKMAALLLSLVLLLGVGAGGTLAWLVDDTDSVVNTFSPSNIDITLKEDETDFRMVPGCSINKDPEVTVLGGSKKCYLFVKLEKSANYSDYLEDYAVITGENAWTKLEDGVYYRIVDASADDQSFGVLVDDKVFVKEGVTKEMMESLYKTGEDGTLEADNDKCPTLTITAYASQYMKTNETPFTPAEAWENAQPNNGK